MRTHLVNYYPIIKIRFYLFPKDLFKKFRKGFLCLSLIFIALCSSKGLNAQTNGFVIWQNGDSVAANIKVYKGIFGGVNTDRYMTQVEIEDSSGKMQAFDPLFLKTFGFTYKDQIYQLYAEPIRLRPSNDTAVRLLTAWIKGPKASVYTYEVTTAGAPSFGTVARTQIFYTFEKPGYKHEYLTNYVKLSTLIKKLSAFYGEFPGIADMINSRFGDRRDIQRDIKAIIDRINEE